MIVALDTWRVGDARNATGEPRLLSNVTPRVVTCCVSLLATIALERVRGVAKGLDRGVRRPCLLHPRT